MRRYDAIFQFINWFFRWRRPFAGVVVLVQFFQGVIDVLTKCSFTRSLIVCLVAMLRHLELFPSDICAMPRVSHARPVRQMDLLMMTSCNLLGLFPSRFAACGDDFVMVVLTVEEASSSAQVKKAQNYKKVHQ